MLEPSAKWMPSISSPPSGLSRKMPRREAETKSAPETRDPAMRQTRKGKQWHFGMKFHVGTDLHGLVHHVVATDAATADITQLPHLLAGTEQDLYGDQAYWKADDRLHWQLAGGRYRVNRRGTKAKPLTDHQKAIKRLWGFTKVRYRGLKKNAARGVTMFGLANLYLVRRRLLPKGFHPCLT